MVVFRFHRFRQSLDPWFIPEDLAVEALEPASLPLVWLPPGLLACQSRCVPWACTLKLQGLDLKACNLKPRQASWVVGLCIMCCGTLRAVL
jgi:hypothetical protein